MRMHAEACHATRQHHTPPGPDVAAPVIADWKLSPTQAVKDVNVYDAPTKYPTKQLAPWSATPSSVLNDNMNPVRAPAPAPPTDAPPCRTTQRDAIHRRWSANLPSSRPAGAGPSAGDGEERDDGLQVPRLLSSSGGVGAGGNTKVCRARVRAAASRGGRRAGEGRAGRRSARRPSPNATPTRPRGPLSSPCTLMHCRPSLTQSRARARAPRSG